jgi:membrane protease subunit (stomatin/prohibitin family)
MRGRGAALVIGMRAGERRAQEAQAQQAAAQEAPQPAAPVAAPAAAPTTTDTAAEIQKLADLHASGALTDEEFTAMKKKLLGL